MYTDFFHIDSRARFIEGQPVVNPNPKPPNNYHFTLPRMLRGVREIELYRAEVPSSMYNITDIDDFFTFTVTIFRTNLPVETLTVQWKIPPGAYTLNSIVEMLNVMKDADVRLAAAGVTPFLLFVADPLTGKLSLTATIPANPTPTVRLELTLHPFYTLGTDVSVSGAGTATSWVVSSQYPVRLQVPLVVFVALTNIRALGTSSEDIEVHSNLFGHANNSTHGHVSRGCIIARLQLTQGQWGVNYLGSENRIYLRQFESGALNLDHLNIVFTDPLGRLIDFNGVDHSLFLRIAYEAR